ncbi:serine, glycine, tyrosine and glutamine-rich protein-like [Sipha flava]|uniref:Serine, glycine, tyrosine and glutamine-rich protein-like n=2 Tax=Sipha flava TaxID=143950 RepID=A0A8B8FSD5_9HEMI|nr:serine, glycine, tyrosine and glutamine-rich protein-like [Sipha flava]
MLQQYQQQPDYTPYGGIGYGTQPDAGYFNYAASESSWYGSPSPGGDHGQMHAGLSHNACNTHIGDSTGNFLNHGYQQTTSTGATTSSAESFASNNHPVSQANMDPMADFLGGHQNMNENDKIIKEESIDWLSSIINDEVDHGNRQDVGDGGSGGGGIGGGGSEGGGGGSRGGAGAASAATAVVGSSDGSGNVKLGDLPCKGHEPNGRLPNFHQAFGSTEIGRFSQHEYYEPPKDASMNECQSAGQPGVSSVPGSGTAQQEERSSVAAFEPPRLQNRRGRTQRGGGQHRRNKQTRAAAAVAAQQYTGYDMSGSAAGGAVVVGGRHLQVPPYHHDPYSRNQHAQQQRYHQEYHHHHQQPTPPPSLYQNHQQQEYYRPSYDRMHYQQQPPPPPPNQYYNNREQSYASGGYNNRFHSCCSTEHIARPNHHNYGPGQYYGDYNNYNQW